MPVDIVEYEPSWQGGFVEQRDRTGDPFASVAAEPVERVGSTAVPGLAAKPIFDVSPVASLVEACRAVSILEEDGWL